MAVHSKKKTPSSELYAEQTRELTGTNSILYSLESIWLFTFSDLKTIVIPETAFGILSALAAEVFEKGQISGHFDWPLVSKAPLVAFWTWINLLPFAIDNQRQPAAIIEDKANKPWRPIPCQRLSLIQAKKLMVVSYLIALCISARFGGLKQSMALVILGYGYNNCGGADANFVVRNFINACGFICYSSGAMDVAFGHLPLGFTLVQWFCIIGGVVFSTVQTQDMYDQAGDSLRARKTVPLVLGDYWSRWSIAIPMAIWSVYCPWFWGLGAKGYFLPVALGYTVALRTMTRRTVEGDKYTFRLWNVWLILLYLLPLIKKYSI